MDPEKQAAQRRQVRSAGQSVLGCAGVIAFFASIYWALGRLPYSITPGPDVYIFIEHSNTNNWLFWALVVGTLFFFLLLGTVKTNWGVLVVCAVFLAGIALALWTLYGHVGAIAFVGNQVELRYVWPRPGERFEPRDILSAKVVESARGTDDQHLFDYSVDLRTRRGDYDTFGNPNDRAARDAVRRIEEMRKR